MVRLTAYTKILLVLGILAFFFIGFLGLGHTTMAMEPGGKMSTGNCFVLGMTAAPCHMSPLEHVTLWQSMFTAIASSDNILLLRTMLTVLVASVVLLFLQKIIVDTFAHRLRYVLQRVPAVTGRPLQEAFSSGVLHPKIF